MGWKHSASTMTLLWKRITHSPARLTLRFVGVNCMVESNECTGSAIAKTHTHTHTYMYKAQTLGEKFTTDSKLERMPDGGIEFCNSHASFAIFRDVISRFNDQNNRFILTFMRRLITRCLYQNSERRRGCIGTVVVVHPAIFGTREET